MAWKWTCRRTSGRRTWRRSICIATASPAPSGGCRCGCSALPQDDGILLAHHLGRALQLTNILRDIDEDAAIGRLYLPREALAARRHHRAPIRSTVVADPALPKVCAPLVERARTHFARPTRSWRRNPRRVVRAPRIMSKYYRAILELLVARGFASAAHAGSPQQNRPHRHSPSLRLHLMQKTVHIIGAGISGLVGRRPAGQCRISRCTSTRPRSRPAAAAGPISTPRPT